MLTVDQIKNNLRIDYDEDDTYLQMLLSASESFIIGAIELDSLPNDPRSDVLQFMLVSLWYENRVSVTSALQQQVPFTIHAMIHQLRGLTDGTIEGS